MKTKPNINCATSTAQSPSHLPAKLTLTEWHHGNQFRYRCAETQQESSERLLVEASRACELAAEIVRTNKEETDQQLRVKLDDIEFRKKELLRIRKEVVLELDASLTYKQRILDTLKSVKENALVICEKCLVAREHRLGVELVCDDVEKELLREREVIRSAESSLARILEETCEEIRKLKSILYCIDHDLKNKEDNLSIDSRNVALKETDLDLSSSHNISHRDKSITLIEWELQTDNNVVNANEEVNNAKRLRCYADKMIKRIIDGLNKQENVTNEAFKRRIEQTQEAKYKLEFQHSEIVKQIAAMSGNIAHIEKSIADKEGFMALACARLGYRCQRPGTELTRDLVDANLTKEVDELRNVAANLRQMLREAEASLRHLLKIQVQLEEDINVKTNTLRIDAVECAALRHSINYHAY